METESGCFFDFEHRIYMSASSTSKLMDYGVNVGDKRIKDRDWIDRTNSVFEGVNQPALASLHLQVCDSVCQSPKAQIMQGAFRF